MAEAKQMEVPQEMREFVAKNIDQAREACKQLMDATSKAQDMMKTLIPANPAVEGLGEVTDRAMRFTRQNLDAGFSLAHELAKAKDLTEMLQIQTGMPSCKCMLALFNPGAWHTGNRCYSEGKTGQKRLFSQARSKGDGARLRHFAIAKEQKEGCALARRRLSPYASAMPVDDTLRGGKPKPVPGNV